MRRIYNLWLVAGFGAVVVSIAVGTVLDALTFDVRGETRSLLENALPSAEYLSNARAELRTVETLGIALTKAPPAERAGLDKELGAALVRLDGQLSAYASTPYFPGEREVFDDVKARLAELRAVLEEARSPSRRAVPTMQMLRSAGTRLDDALLALTQVNIVQGERVSRRIGRIWRRETTVSLVVDISSAAVALISMFGIRYLLKKYAALSEAHQRAVETRAEELESFAGRVAHDLRNPLSALAVGVATANRLGPEQAGILQSVLGRMHAGIERMEGLIDGLLAFATAGAAPVPGDTCELQPVLEGVVEDVFHADEEGMEVSIRPFPPASVACSRGALMSILSNLLQNAVKYTRGMPSRRVTVGVLVRSEVVHVEVEDNGPGIPPGMERRLFEPFVRLPGSTEPGLGLGLATVKKLVVGYGGRVGVRSREGGSTFWFELPSAPGAEQVSQLPH